MVEALNKSILEKEAEHKGSIETLQSKLSDLQSQNEELSKEVHSLKEKQQDSGADNNSDANEEVARLKYLLELESNKSRELDASLHQLRDNENNANIELGNLKIEAEKLQVSNQASLNELKKDNAELKELIASASKAVELPPNFNVLSPRTQKTELNKLPAWKLREMERQKEQEAQRADEQNRKLVKVQSLKVLGNTVDHSTSNPNFKDPVSSKVTAQPKDDSPRDKIPSAAATLSDEDAQAKMEAEMARINKTMKRGGHQV